MIRPLLLALTWLWQDPHLRSLGPDPAIVVPGEPSRVTLAVDGDAPAILLEPSPPAEVTMDVGAPLRTRAQALVDGRLAEVTRTTWRIAMSAARSGRFDVPPFQVRVADTVISGGACTLQVMAQADADLPAFVACTIAPATCHVQGQVEVCLRFGFERNFLADRLVPLVQRRLALPVEVCAPFLGDLTDAANPPADPVRVASLILDGREALATREEDVVRDGQRFAVFALRRRLVAEREGTLTLPAPALRFAFATRFADDLFSGRVPLDRRDGFVSGAPTAIEVLALPPAGRPAEFLGAVGRFAVAAAVDRSAIEVGASLKVSLRITGTGNLPAFAAPAFPATGDFHVLGVLDDHGELERTVVYDVAPRRAAVTEVPPLRLAYFDPDDGAGYRVVETAPIALRVHGGASDADLVTPPPPAPTADDENELTLKAVALKPVGESAAPTGWHAHRRAALVLLAGFLLPWLWVAAWLWRCWRSACDRRDPRAARMREAGRGLARALRDPAADLRQPLAAYLAAHLDRAEPAAIDAGLAQRLAATGMPATLAEASAATLLRLTASGYGALGAGEPPVDAAAVRALFAALEADPARPGGGR